MKCGIIYVNEHIFMHNTIYTRKEKNIKGKEEFQEKFIRIFFSLLNLNYFLNGRFQECVEFLFKYS